MNAILTRIGNFLARFDLPQGPVAQTQAVYALTDEELEARGMKRRDAARQLMINGDWS